MIQVELKSNDTLNTLCDIRLDSVRMKIFFFESKGLVDAYISVTMYLWMHYKPTKQTVI
jgi:hypothetical protein